jgi:hypothetical protein
LRPGTQRYQVDANRGDGGHWPFMDPRTADAEWTAVPAVRTSIVSVIIIQ